MSEAAQILAQELITFVKKCQANPWQENTNELAQELVDLLFRERKAAIEEMRQLFREVKL